MELVQQEETKYSYQRLQFVTSLESLFVTV